VTEKTKAPKKPRNRRKPTRIWRLVTNQQNMLYMLAAGMVMSPAGFRGKHYADPLSDYPGWIPLFRDKAGIPAMALDEATSERKHLLPCIASFDLHGLSADLQMLPCKGKTRAVSALPERKGKNELAALVRSPFPLSSLSTLSFRSREDLEAFKTAAGEVSNIDPPSHLMEVSESLFAEATDRVWPPNGVDVGLALGDTPPVFGLALGGVIAMLYHAANRSALGLAAFRSITGGASDKDEALVQGDPMLAELPAWVKGDAPAGSDTRARLFWGVVQSLIDAQTSGGSRAPVDVTLAYLESQLDRLPETKFRPHLERLITDMRGSFGLDGGTATELFERNKGGLSRSLVLFCLREHCVELLDFSHPLLSDVDYVLACILFGVRDTWLQIPREMRRPDLSAYVSFRMAGAEHRRQGNDLVMDAPRRPSPLIELFASSGGGLNGMTKGLALEFAVQSNWHDCIRTRITLAQGDWPERFERKGSQIVLPGRIKCTEELVESVFLRRLGQWPPVSSGVEREIREKLKRIAEPQEQGQEALANEDDSKPAA